MQPLKGLRVLDLSKVLAGPLCGQYLGELGADVIKVEPVGTGDDTRAWLPQEKGQSATFLAVNHNKRSIALDLKSAAGRGVVHKLAAQADIVLQGFGGGTAAKLGVDYGTLKALNPRLIYCEISGYGRDGPMGQAPGYDVMLQAFSGMISTMGEPDGGFARASFSPVDLGTGMHALSGVLAAVIERGRTGEGAYLEVALLDTALGFMGYQAQNFWRTGKTPQRMGTAHPAMSPYQAFRTSDGHIMLGVGNEVQWKRFCEVAGLQHIAADPDFATNKDRVRNFARTVELVQRKIETRSLQQWLDALQPAGIPCSAINTLDQALAHPQVATRGLITTVDHPVLGPLHNMGLPVRFGGAARTADRAPPMLGQHTAEVLREAGYADEDISALQTCGAIN